MARRSAVADPIMTRITRAVAEAIRGHHVRAWIVAVIAVTMVGTLGYVVLFGWSGRTPCT